MHGISLGPADLAASRAMKTTRVGGGHPDYVVLADPGADAQAPREKHQQDLWHYTIAKMVDATASAGIKAFYGPFGDFSDPAACEAQFRNAFLMGCAGAWTLHPSQVAIAKRVFSPDVAEVAFALKILAAMPDGTGAVMIDGKMQDDATWKQAKVVVDLARLVAGKDPDLAAFMDFEPVAAWDSRYIKRHDQNHDQELFDSPSKSRLARYKLGEVVSTAYSRFAASSSTSTRCSTTRTNGGCRSPRTCGRARISRSIICSPRTAKLNTWPMCLSRTCCPTRRASRSAIRRCLRCSSATTTAAISPATRC